MSWGIERLQGAHGSPFAVFPWKGVEANKKENGHGKMPLTEAAKNAGFDDPSFRDPHKQRATEKDPNETTINSGFERGDLSVAHSIYSPSEGRHGKSSGPNGPSAEGPRDQAENICKEKF